MRVGSHSTAGSGAHATPGHPIAGQLRPAGTLPDPSRPCGGPGPAPPPLRQRGGRERAILVGLVLLLVLPVLGLALSHGPYAPDMDRALFELGLRRLADGAPPSVGVFSRFGWYHPGPALYYLVGVPYLVAGLASAAMPVTAVLVNGACLTAALLLIRRHRGMVCALLSLVICLVYLRQLPESFLLDVWNPYLPLLPFLLAALLCWASLLGDRWALPAAVALLSLCVQAHVGYAPASAALLAVTAAGLGWLRTRRSVVLPPARAWLAAGTIVALMWAPPLWQQVTGRDGNLGDLISDLWAPKAGTQSVDAGVRLVGTELGRLPAAATGVSPRSSVFFPPRLPLWLAVLALAALCAACLWGARRRDRAVVALGVLAATTAVAGVVAVTRVQGLLFSYLVPWAAVAGVLLWITVGAAVVSAVAEFGGHVPADGADPADPAGSSSSRPGGSRRTRAPAAVALAVLLSTLPPIGLVVARNSGPVPGNAADPTRVAEAVVRRLGLHGNEVIAVNYLPTLGPTLLGVTGSGAGLVLALEKRGVAVQPPLNGRLGFSPVLPAVRGLPRWALLLGLAGRSPPPPPGFGAVARTDQLVAYARAVTGCIPEVPATCVHMGA